MLGVLLLLLFWQEQIYHIQMGYFGIYRVPLMHEVRKFILCPFNTNDKVVWLAKSFSQWRIDSNFEESLNILFLGIGHALGPDLAVALDSQGQCEL